MAAQIGRGGVWQPPTGPTRAGRVTADPSALNPSTYLKTRFSARRHGGTPSALALEQRTGASPRPTLSNALLTSAGAIHAEPTTRRRTWPDTAFGPSACHSPWLAVGPLPGHPNVLADGHRAACGQGLPGTRRAHAAARGPARPPPAPHAPPARPPRRRARARHSSGPSARRAHLRARRARPRSVSESKAMCFGVLRRLGDVDARLARPPVARRRRGAASRLAQPPPPAEEAPAEAGPVLNCPATREG